MNGNWYLNGSDLYATYGVAITKGSYNDIMSPPIPRKRMEYEYTDEDGIRVDKTTPLVFEPKRYKIKVVIVANGFSQFWGRYNAFFNVLAIPGTITLRVAPIGVSVKVFYEGAKNVDKIIRLKNGRVASAFELSVFEPNPKERIYD